jgi:hypothetical protein
MAAVTEVAPLLSPMESVTGTGFTVPVRLAFRVPARNAYRAANLGRAIEIAATVGNQAAIARWRDVTPPR